MRLPIQVRHFRLLAAIAMLAGLVTLQARAQESPAMPGQVRNQLNQAQTTSPSASTDAAQSSSAGSSKPAGQHAAAKPKTSHKPASTAPAPSAASASVAMTGRRDPFTPLLAADQSGSARQENLPPGKAGLMVDTLRVDGIVQGPNGMIAIVENPQARVYFLREGDKLYDGSVTHIVLDAVSFHQTGTDAFGKPVDRELTKRLNPSSTGDSQ
jgi:hypothetical protein